MSLEFELWKRQGGICPWCSEPLGRDFSVLEADHIIPKCRGGPHKLWNRQLLHMICNRRKSYRLTEEARALAAEHGVTLREPRPTAWEGSSVLGGRWQWGRGQKPREPRGAVLLEGPQLELPFR